MESLGGWRKVVVTLAVYVPVEAIASVAWLVLGKMTATEWSGVSEWVTTAALGFFVTGNIVERVTNARVLAAQAQPPGAP